MGLDVHDLAAALASPEAKLRFRQGAVTAIAADGTLSVTIAGSATVIAGVKCLSSCAARVGAAVWLATDGQDLLALGTISPVGPAWCRLARPSNQAIETGTAEAVDFTASPGELSDPHGMFSTSATDRVTIVTPGVYSIAACVAFSAAATGYRNLQILKGSTVIASDRKLPSSSSDTILCPSTHAGLAAGDEISLLVYQSSGSTVDIEYGAGRSCLSLAWLGPAG